MRYRTKVTSTVGKAAPTPPTPPTPTKPAPKSKRAKRLPKPGTFAAFILDHPASVSDAEVSRRAIAAGHTESTPRKVYAKRWYYGVTERPLLRDVVKAVPNRAELRRVIVAQGVDAARAVIAEIESHGAAVADYVVPARESA